MTTLPLGPQRHDIDLGEGVHVVHVERWLDRRSAATAFFALHDGVAWAQEMSRPGVPLPRLTAWWGEKPYVYSGITNKPQPLSAIVEEIRRLVEADVEHAFNSCLGNLYRDGSDTVGWHADDERGLEPDPMIASVSFGAARRFDMFRVGAPQRKLRLTLGAGDLLVMGRGCQRLWQHAIPRQAGATEPRISLTFRRMA